LFHKSTINSGSYANVIGVTFHHQPQSQNSILFSSGHTTNTLPAFPLNVFFVFNQTSDNCNIDNDGNNLFTQRISLKGVEVSSLSTPSTLIILSSVLSIFPH
jgi:hypothetical protein